MAVPKPMRTEFGIHHRLESCAYHLVVLRSRGETKVDICGEAIWVGRRLLSSAELKSGGLYSRLFICSAVQRSR